jgi:hypothetical protein
MPRRRGLRGGHLPGGAEDSCRGGGRGRGRGVVGGHVALGAEARLGVAQGDLLPGARALVAEAVELVVRDGPLGEAVADAAGCAGPRVDMYGCVCVCVCVVGERAAREGAGMMGEGGGVPAMRAAQPYLLRARG